MFDGANQALNVGGAAFARALNVSGSIRVDNADAVEFGGTTSYIQGSSATGGDLTLASADDIVLDAGDDILIKKGATAYALFDGVNESLSIGHTATPGVSVKLDVRNSPGTAGAIVSFNNQDSSAVSPKRILLLKFSGDATISTAEDWIRFSDSGGEVGRIHSEVSYGTFTGMHEGQVPNRLSVSRGPGAAETVIEHMPDGTERRWLVGMIVCSTGVILDPTMSRALPELRLADHSDDPCVMGVYSGIRVDHEVKGLDRARPALSYNALGEGQMLVCDLRGELRCGDLITSCELIGIGARQLQPNHKPDTLFHSTTVAKCTQNIDWSGVVPTQTAAGPVRIARVGCTYHCG